MAQQPLRGSTPGLRESPGAAVHASWANTHRLRIAGRVLFIALLFSVFFSVLRVRTAYEGGFLGRGLQFFVITLVAILLSMVCQIVFRRWPPVARRMWVRGVLTGLIMTVPMALLVWGIDLAVADHKPLVSDLPGYILVSLGVSIFMSLLSVTMMQERLVFVPVESRGPTVRFLDRLPPKLRGAQVWAVEAEDHYLRLHTSKGQDLILMRLADAVAELDGVEGLQVHRSWWVARDAIADIARGDGRATLTLQDGSQVPVSRTYAKVLRERGWM
jgi:hypothetical protein